MKKLLLAAAALLAVTAPAYAKSHPELEMMDRSNDQLQVIVTQENIAADNMGKLIRLSEDKQSRFISEISNAYTVCLESSAVGESYTGTRQIWDQAFFSNDPSRAIEIGNMRLSRGSAYIEALRRCIAAEQAALKAAGE